MRHGRHAPSCDELDQAMRRLTPEEREELVTVSVAWWDGVPTGLRARTIEGDNPR